MHRPSGMEYDQDPHKKYSQAEVDQMAESMKKQFECIIQRRLSRERAVLERRRTRTELQRKKESEFEKQVLKAEIQFLKTQKIISEHMHDIVCTCLRQGIEFTEEFEHLIDQQKVENSSLQLLVATVKDNMQRCIDCFSYFEKPNKNEKGEGSCQN